MNDRDDRENRMTEEMRKAYEDAVRQRDYCYATFPEVMFSAGAAWGAAARQRFDADLCRQRGKELAVESPNLSIVTRAFADDLADAIESKQMPEGGRNER